MPKKDATTDTITLRGEEIPVTICQLEQAELSFFPENPRVYSVVAADDKTPTQEEIERTLTRMDHVKQLIQSIKANGGLTDPLLVRDGDMVVLEGNSRLAAYRKLFEKDSTKWRYVKCKLLPEGIGDDKVFALLGEYHIIGRKDWAPYEQAGYLFRRHQKHKVSASTMAEELGMSTKAVSSLIEVYRFMVDHGEDSPQKWSYYEEYLRPRAIQKIREEYPQMDELVVEKIRSEEIARAVDVRKKLRVVCKAPKAARQFATGKRGLEAAFEIAVARGADSDDYNRLKRFQTWLGESETFDDLAKMEPSLRDKCAYSLDKIKKRCAQLLKKLEKKS